VFTAGPLVARYARTEGGTSGTGAVPVDRPGHQVPPVGPSTAADRDTAARCLPSGL